VFGFLLIALATYQVFVPNVPAATLCAAVGVLLLLLARISQFKRIKGWGFEAEMWEDKQEEAAALIASMRKVAAINSREIVLNAVTSGRWSSGKIWKGIWDLFQELQEIQGGVIDRDSLKKLKKTVDDWFLRDMISKEYGILKTQVSKGCAEARHKLLQQFGNPVVEKEKFMAQSNRLSSLDQFGDDLLALASNRLLSKSIIVWWAEAKDTLSEFSVSIDADPSVLIRLSKYEVLESLDEVPITAELIKAADD
jgi:hypothetical protein